MADQPPERQSLERLEQELQAARKDADKAAGRDKAEGSTSSGMAVGLRVGTDMVAGVVVGTLIGVGLDKWWGTRPWMMMLFFIIGCAAGILGAYRTASGIDHSVGFGAAKRRGAQGKDGQGPKGES